MLKITIENYPPGSSSAEYRCLLHTNRQAYWVGPRCNHAEAQHVRDEVLASIRSVNQETAVSR